jgi:hypothetical protein
VETIELIQAMRSGVVVERDNIARPGTADRSVTTTADRCVAARRGLPRLSRCWANGSDDLIARASEPTTGTCAIQPLHSFAR